MSKRTTINVAIDFYIPTDQREAEELVRQWLDILRSSIIGMNKNVQDHRKRFAMDESYKIIGEEVIDDEDKHKSN